MHSEETLEMVHLFSLGKLSFAFVSTHRLTSVSLLNFLEQISSQESKIAEVPGVWFMQKQWDCLSEEIRLSVCPHWAAVHTSDILPEAIPWMGHGSLFNSPKTRHLLLIHSQFSCLLVEPCSSV